MFHKIEKKEELCVLGISVACYHQDENAVSSDMTLLGNKRSVAASPIYWEAGIIRKVCLSPKATHPKSL